MIYPAKFPAHNDNHGERKVFEALRQLDPHNFDIFWSRGFTGKTTGEDKHYEIDFLVFDLREERLDHIYVIEVKGGRVEFRAEENAWYQNSREMIPAPDHQVMGYVSNLLKRYKEFIEHKVPVTWLLWFPDGLLDKDKLPTQCEAWNVLDQEDLDDPRVALNRAAEAVENEYSHFKRISIDDYKTTLQKDLLQSLEVSENFRTLLENMEINIDKTEESQKAFFNGLWSYSRLAVEGGAGSGKTVLAKCAAEVLEKKGKKVLFLCYNTYLCSELRADLNSTIKTDNIHNLMRDFADDREPEWFGAQDKDRDFWDQGLPEKFKELLKNKPLREEEKFDVILVDEAQDFEVGWLNMLLKYLKSDAQFFLFYDKRQNIFERNFMLPQGQNWHSHLLNCNYRNTEKINVFINETVGTEAVSYGVEEGEEVRVKEYAPGEMAGALKRCLLELHNVGRVPKEQIMILTDGSTTDWDLKIHSNGFEYEILDPVKAREKEKIYFSSIRRFKGCEAPAVILLLKQRLEEIIDGKAKNKNRLYTQLSRAKSLLYVLEPEKKIRT
jgi:DNA replication protein DnaC